jgi:type IX secretion system PorP/SprF family membrane protein
MKRIASLIAIVVGVGPTAMAQQVPLTSYYFYNKFLYNPALAGVENYGQAYLIIRNQWGGIPDAPKTQAFTMDGPMRKKNIGIGVGLFNDQAGSFNITSGQVAYRYSINFNADQSLAFGMGLGFLNNRIDFNKLKAQDMSDPVIMNAYQQKTGFDANIGVNYKWKELNVGFSVPQVIANDLSFQSLQQLDKNVSYGLIRHFIINTNYSWDIKKDGVWFLEPTVLVRATPGTPLQYDVNAVINWKKKLWLGAMYRSAYAATFSVGMRLADQFVLGYSYDLVVNTYKTYMNGAHEVLLGYQFGGKSSDDPEIKKKFKEIDDKVKKNTDDIDSLGKETKKNRDDIDKNTEDIEKNTEDIDGSNDEIEQMKGRMQKFEDFMKSIQEGGKLGKGTGTTKVGDVYSFANVYFETNKWDIQGVNLDELNTLVTVLKENPSLKIEVAGHADERGTDSYNKWLSTKRSNAVVDYLKKQGVPASQLAIMGYGEAPGPLDENRRVEFKILSK